MALDSPIDVPGDDWVEVLPAGFGAALFSNPSLCVTLQIVTSAAKPPVASERLGTLIYAGASAVIGTTETAERAWARTNSPQSTLTGVLRLQRDYVAGGDAGAATAPTPEQLAAAVEAATGDSGFVAGKSSIDGRPIIAKTNDTTDAIALFEFDGVTPITDGSTFEFAGSDVVAIRATPAADLVEGSQYHGTLAAGTYTRANILALSGGTRVVEFTATVRTGTADLDQGGAVQNLPAGAIFEFAYRPGFAMADFTLTVSDGETAVSIAAV